VRLDARMRRSGESALRANEKGGVGFESGSDRRHPRPGTGPGLAAHPHGPDLDVCGGRRASVHGVRLHPQPQPRRAGGVPEGVSGVSAGRRVLRVRSLLSGAPARHCRGRMLGPREAALL
jgi:hypothetical protein